MSDYIRGETVVMVKEESKFGFKDMDGNFWSMSGKVNKADFKPGVQYSLNWYQKEGGKNKYINSGTPVKTAGIAAVAAASPSIPISKPVAAKPEIKKDASPVQSRDTSIERQAVLKSVLESPVLAKLADSIGDAEVLGARMFQHFFKVLKGD